MTRIVDRIWYDPSGWAVAARFALTPPAALYGSVIAARNALFDRGWFDVESSPIPAVSIGNLAVGGTGKTPVAAWMAGELTSRGAHPAIVMRGYGADEPLVHTALNPGVPVLVHADRALALRAAAARGADLAVMDDAFQHRRASRTEDVVLVSADRWREPFRVLPAGPGREPLSALRRASLVLVTRKATSARDAVALQTRLARRTRSGQGAVAYLSLGPLVDYLTGAERPLADLRGARVLVASGVGDPRALAAQLEYAGAVVQSREFPDHHVYESADIAALISEGSRTDFLVCTLKDAVKLGMAWPRAAGPLWYVSQRCEMESGGAEMSALLDRLLAARSLHQLAAGPVPGA
ncbi:MAG TPA: tetraacyldisaccharide 4'-kinase [Gemmatimonadaceae bacterium]